jgi:hypothetical protein
MTAPTRDSDNALVLKNGFVLVADEGTAGPSDLTTAWPAGFDSLGWCDDSGFGEAKSGDVTKKYAIDGSVLKIVKGSDERTFTFTCSETNAVVLGLVNPGSTPVTATGVTTTAVKPNVTPVTKAFGLEFVYAGGITRRVVVGKGVPTLTDTITSQYTDVTSYKFSVDCLVDASGNLYTNISNNPAEVVA